MKNLKTPTVFLTTESYEANTQTRDFSPKGSAEDRDGGGGNNAQSGRGASTDNILAKLYLHNQFGGGNPFVLDASTMDLSGTNQTELEISGKERGPINLFNAGVNFLSLAFGVLDVSRIGSTDYFRIKNNRFDFDYQPGKSFGRTAGTFVGGAVFGQFFNIPITPWGIIRNNFGFGGSFDVVFNGVIYIPK